MFCPKCGTTVDNGARFCPVCGTVMPAPQAPQQPQYQAPQYQQPQYQQPQYQQPQYQQPQYQAPQPQYQQPQYQAPQYQQPQYQNGAPLNQNAALGMGWYKFLIYFALFASAILNAVNGINLFTGEMYDGAAELVYEIIDGLQALDMFVAGASIVVACMAIYVRMRLAGYYKNGPKMLNNLYLAVVAVQLIYIIGIYIIFEDAAEAVDFGGAYTNIAIGCAMMGVNASYFKKRAHLFVND